jgi:hypothetical protein
VVLAAVGASAIIFVTADLVAALFDDPRWPRCSAG